MVKPEFTCEKPAIVAAYNLAYQNVCTINVVGSPAGRIIRAGSDYANAWIRDAAINTFSAGSLLLPAIAETTLRQVTARQANGSFSVQEDNQWWDSIVWVVAAWRHFCTTGNKAFLSYAFECSVSTYERLVTKYFCAETGLFRGPSFFNDGIAGYPPELCEEDNLSSFVLDHPATHHIFCLSTNCIYLGALHNMASMSTALKNSTLEQKFRTSAAQLRASIKSRLQNQDGTFAYYANKGARCKAQEGAGYAFAVLFGLIENKEEAARLLASMHRMPRGTPSIWPAFEGFDSAHPGRHNNILWPMINGLLGMAAGACADAERLYTELETIALLALESGGNFYEIYNATDGRVDGGWQRKKPCGGKPQGDDFKNNMRVQWESCSNQTWSASTYIGVLLYGVLGIDVLQGEIRIEPCLPTQLGDTSISELEIAGTTLDIHLEGSGRIIKSCTVNGVIAPPIVATGQGSVSVVISLI